MSERPACVVTCVSCGANRATILTPRLEPRAPAGWHRREADFYCPGCWLKRYILRTISLPVSSPIDISWEELRKLLKIAWAQTTACANRIVTECYACDV